MSENSKGQEVCNESGTTVSAISSSVILTLVAILGFSNSYRYLYKMEKYKAYPLTLCYVACQLTLLVAIARVIMIATMRVQCA